MSVPFQHEKLFSRIFFFKEDIFILTKEAYLERAIF